MSLDLDAHRHDPGNQHQIHFHTYHVAIWQALVLEAIEEGETKDPCQPQRSSTDLEDDGIEGVLKQSRLHSLAQVTCKSLQKAKSNLDEQQQA